MSGRAIYVSASGRLGWIPTSAFPGRALYAGLPSHPGIYLYGWNRAAATVARYYPDTSLPGPDLDWHEPDEYGVSLGLVWIWHDSERWNVTVKDGPYYLTFANSRAGVGGWGVCGYYSYVPGLHDPGSDPSSTGFYIVSTIIQPLVIAPVQILPAGGSGSGTVRLSCYGLKRVAVFGTTFPAHFHGDSWSGVLEPGEYHDISYTTDALPPYSVGGPQTVFDGVVRVAASVNVPRATVWIANAPGSGD